jgi:hypothetical protein
MAKEVSTRQALRDALSAADHSAFLVEARVIRRFIRERSGAANLAIALPHTHSQVVSATDIRSFAHPDELGLVSFETLPDECLFICEPEKGELDHWPLEELKQQVWRRLFHAKLDRELNALYQDANPKSMRQKIAEVGQVEFDEAHYVLRSELRLMDPESRDEALRELAAIHFEFQYFEPDLLPVWFPSLTEKTDIQQVLAHRLNVDAIFRSSQLVGATEPDLISHVQADEDRLVSARKNWSLAIGISQSDRGYLRQLRKRDRANEKGNTVYAIACAVRASQRSTTEGKKATAETKAQEDVRRLVNRLRSAIAFEEHDEPTWQAALSELAKNSVQGFWNAEKRLLYDLQRVCLDHERLTYKVDLVKWVVSRGGRPLRRPLKSLREVAMAKHLASAASRLTHVRLSGIDRNRLIDLIEHAASLSETQMRERIRPVLTQTLLDVKLLPKSLPERVASEKLVEESLDCIAERGYLTMGYLRDAISRNDLKLPDVRELREVWYGDQLLRADDRLDLALDGVYRRGEFYLRWLQVVSSFFFGTQVGRFATLFIIIPFGGAVVLVEGFLHVLHMFHRPSHTPDALAIDSHVNDVIEANTLPADKPPANDGIDSESNPNAIDSSTTDSPNPSKIEALVDLPTKQLADDGSSPLDWLSQETETTILVPAKTTDEAARQIVTRQTDTFSSVVILGMLLMALIHAPRFRHFCTGAISKAIQFARTVLFETPMLLLNLPILTSLWTAKLAIQVRRYAVMPILFAMIVGRIVPWLVFGRSLGWWWVASIALGSSLLLSTRIGRDAQELTRDWIENAVHQLRARLVFAIFGWVVDFFRLLLSSLERILYAVDEWLRFHSDENWLSVVAKAILGVVWSLISFLIRIYVNLLIEPTFHPVKHFPVVTVAHKIFLPALIMLEGNMVHFIGQYTGTPLARSITWFNIFFLPGFFGFAVWELKENWKLYLSNRTDRLKAVPVGSHGETIARLLRPGFHSGTLPKIFRKLRRLEHREASLGRFASRRSNRQKLHHVEHAVQAFVQREFISLLSKCDAWLDHRLECTHVEAASNSCSIDLECVSLGDVSMKIRLQEQSGWLMACVSQAGWMKNLSDEQRNSFSNALEGFYRKCGIDLVREQLENNFTKDHAYDVDSMGLVVWPNHRFDVEITTHLKQLGTLNPQPINQAAQVGLKPVERERIVFAATHTSRSEWEKKWADRKLAESTNEVLHFRQHELI